VSGTINEYRLVKFGTADRAALQAGASTDKFIGVAGLPKAQPQQVATQLM